MLGGQDTVKNNDGGSARFLRVFSRDAAGNRKPLTTSWKLAITRAHVMLWRTFRARRACHAAEFPRNAAASRRRQARRPRRRRPFARAASRAGAAHDRLAPR